MIEKHLAATLDAGLAHAPAEGATAAQLIDRVGAREGLLRRLAAAQQADLVAFETARVEGDRRDPGVGPRLAGRTVGTEVGLALGISPTAGAGRVSFARTVVAHHDALHDLASAGAVSEWALRLVSTATSVLDVDQQAAVAAQLAADVRRRAEAGLRQYTPYELAQAAARRVIKADPDAATRRCERARADRRVAVGDKHDGVASLWATGPAEQTLAMHDALDHTARARRNDGDDRAIGDLMFATLVESVLGIPNDSNSDSDGDPAAAAADTPATTGEPGPGLGQHDLDPDDQALDDYATHSPAAAADQTAEQQQRRRGRRRRPGPGMRVEAHIVLGVGALLGLDEEPAMLRGYGPIPAELARQITDPTTTNDSSSSSGSGLSESARVMLRRLFFDPTDGRLLTMDSVARCYVGGLRDFTNWRDQHCRLSGGKIRHDDHALAVVEGGETTAGNAQGLTINSHVLKDHPGITVTPNPVTGDPVTGDPGTGDPVTGDPVTGDPVTGDPVTGDPDTGDPGREDRSRLDELRANAPDLTWTMPTGHAYRCPPPPVLGHGSQATDIDVPPPRPRPSDAAVDAAIARIVEQAPAAQRRNAKRRRHRLRRRTRLAARHRQRTYRAALRRRYKAGLYTRIQVVHPTLGTTDIYPNGIPGLSLDLELHGSQRR